MNKPEITPPPNSNHSPDGTVGGFAELLQRNINAVEGTDLRKLGLKKLEVLLP